MLGARIDVVEASIWNFNAYPAVSARQKRQQLWLNEIKRADWTDTIVKHDRVCSSHFISEKVQ